MGSKTISLKDEAYNRLKALKNENKSFSDVIIELTENENSKFENITDIGAEMNFEDLKKMRERTESDNEREELLLR